MAESIISPGVYTRENDISYITPAPIVAGAAFVGPTVKGPDNQPLIVTSYSDYVRKFGETFTSASNKQYEFLTSVAVKNYFQNGGQTALVTRIVSGTYSRAASTFISASAKPGSQPFTLETLGKGTLYNNASSSLAPLQLTGSGQGYLNSDGSLVSGSADNLRWEIANTNTSQGTFSVVVRQGNDNTNNKTILETFTVNLDPNSDKYIEKVIGNQYVSVATDSSTGVSYNYVNGEYPNASNYIRVSSVGLTTNYYLANDGITVNLDGTGTSYSASLPVTGAGSFYNATGAVSTNATFFSAIGTTSGEAQGIVPANYATALSLLANRDEYQFNIISTPGVVYNNGGFASTVSQFIALAESRGDCIAVVDLVPTGSILSTVTTEAASLNSSYAATYWPWLQIKSATGRNEWTPAGTVIPGVYAFTDASSAPWFAPAGLVRGGIG